MTRQLTVEQIERWRNGPDDSEMTGDQFVALCDLAIDSLRSQPAGGRDAERYRWLRDEENDLHHDYRLRIFDERGVMLSLEEFDKAVDEAKYEQEHQFDAAMKESAK